MNSSSSPTENFLAPFSDGNWSSTLVSFNLDDACCPNGTVDQCTWSDYNSSIDLSVLRLQGFRKYLLEACLTLSAFSLVLSFLVYSLVPELRTVPGKCLMGLIVSEFITDTLVIAALQNQPCTLACSIIGVLIHYFYLTIFCWTSVIAIDILKKLKYPNQKLKKFVRYIYVVYLIPLVIVSLAVGLELAPQTAQSSFRPLYGRKICSVSNPLGKLVFITVPINISLFINVVIFLFLIYKIKHVVNEITVITITVKKRCLWYGKLSLMLGISSLFGFFGIQLPCCRQFKFISFLINSLHGTLIFIAFTCKRSTFRLLAKHILPCRQRKSTTAIDKNSSKKLTRCALDENGLDSQESSLRGTSRMHRGPSPGLGFATTTTLTSSNENSPQRGHIALYSLDPRSRTCSYPKFDSMVIE